MSRAQVRTLRPDGTGARYLGELGPVGGLRYSFTLPGGCDQMTAVLSAPPVLRTSALDPGRITEVLLGGSVVWQGILAEPEPDPAAGWNLTAIGSGNWGSMWRAVYTGTWSAAVPDDIITGAIGRGLDWEATALGHPAGIWLGQAADSGSMAVDEVLNQVTSKGSLTWQVKLTPRGNVLQMFAVPSAPNRLLICTAPAGRTLGGDINAICLRYQSAPDLGAGFPATYATVYSTDAASIARHGRQETYLDLSSAGPMPAADAQAVGDGILTRYQRASYAGPFGVQPGQLLTLGGEPADLGVFYGPENGMCCRLMLADQGWGGEVTMSVPVFAVGRYEYDDDTNTATVEPFNSIRGDIAALSDERAGLAHGRRIIRRTYDGFSWWRFQGTGKWHRGPRARARRHHHRRAPGGGGRIGPAPGGTGGGGGTGPG